MRAAKRVGDPIPVNHACGCVHVHECKCGAVMDCCRPECATLVDFTCADCVYNVFLNRRMYGYAGRQTPVGALVGYGRAATPRRPS